MHSKNAHDWKSFPENVQSRLDDCKPSWMIDAECAHTATDREIGDIEDNAVHDRKYEDIKDYFNPSSVLDCILSM